MGRQLLKRVVQLTTEHRAGGFRTITTKNEVASPILGVREHAPIEKVKEIRRAPRHLAVGAGKTAGRNSAGRITAFHRGGGSKRLQRIVDLKRSTPSTGIIERIDYDPNRSARLALVRWVDGAQSYDKRKGSKSERTAPLHMTVEAATTTPQGVFPLSSLYSKADDRMVTCISSRPMTAHVVVGISAMDPSCSKSLFTTNEIGNENISARDIFLSAFSSKAKGDRPFLSSSSLTLPRIAVAGARPSFFASLTREKIRDQNPSSHFEVKKWNSNSTYWAQRIKRKTAIPWQSLECFRA